MVAAAFLKHKIRSTNRETIQSYRRLCGRRARPFTRTLVHQARGLDTPQSHRPSSSSSSGGLRAAPSAVKTKTIFPETKLHEPSPPGGGGHRYFRRRPRRNHIACIYTPVFLPMHYDDVPCPGPWQNAFIPTLIFVYTYISVIRYHEYYFSFAFFTPTRIFFYRT